MGNDQSAENERRRSAHMQAMLEKNLEKQRELYEKRCRQLLQAQSLLYQQNSVSASCTPTVAADNSRGQNTLYPDLSHTPDQSPAYVVNTNLQFHNVISENRAQMNLPSSPNTQNFNFDHNMTRPIPSAPQAVSCSPPNVTRPMVSKRNEMGSEFNCRTCGNKFGLIIFQCGSGHSSCQQCKLDGGICRFSNCGKMITNIRNRTLEAYMADLSVAAENLQNKSVGCRPKKNERNTHNNNCPNYSDGCTLRFHINEIDNHLKECPFNEMSCPLASIFGRCFWRGKINQLDSHFSDCHPEHRQANVDTEMTILNFKDSNRIVYLVMLGNYNFLIHVKVDINVQMLYMVVQLLGTQVSANKWHYEFHVYNKAKPRRKYMYSDICISNTASVDDIFANNKCVVIPFGYVSTYENNCCINYKFYIKKHDQDKNIARNNN